METLRKRINELAAKARTDGLTDAEIAERDILRQEYLKKFRAGMEQRLDNTYLLRPDGTKEKLVRRGKQ